MIAVSLPRLSVLDPGSILAGVAFVMAPLALYAPLGIAPVFIVAAVLLLIGDWRGALGAWRIDPILGSLLLALGLWGVISAEWSILPTHSLFEGLRFLLEAAGGLILFQGATRLEPERRDLIMKALLAGALLAVALLAVERILHAGFIRALADLSEERRGSFSRFDRGATVLALLSWSIFVGFGVRRRWTAAILFAAVVFALILLSASRAAMLACVLGAWSFGIALLWPRFVAAALILVIAFGGIALPEFAPDGATIGRLHDENPALPLSFLHRLGIWRFATLRIAERPMLGWGMDSARGLPGGGRSLTELMPEAHFPRPLEAMPLHPHDAPLQWRLELGLPGLVLGVALVGWILLRIAGASLSRFERAGAVGLAAAGVTIALFSFGTWQSWWLCSLWLVAALFSTQATGARPP